MAGGGGARSQILDQLESLRGTGPAPRTQLRPQLLRWTRLELLVPPGGGREDEPEDELRAQDVPSGWAPVDQDWDQGDHPVFQEALLHLQLTSTLPPPSAPDLSSTPSS